MNPVKLIWFARAIIYKLRLKRMGRFSYLGEPLYLEGCSKIEIGDRTRIFPGLRMEAIGTGTISIGCNTVIEQNVHIISMTSKLCIGNDVTIAPNVFITNVNHGYSDISKSVMEQGYIIRDTKISDGCFIGYGAAIQAGTILGKHCVVASNAVVKGSFPDCCIIAGNPGKIIKKYNTNTQRWEKCL